MCPNSYELFSVSLVTQSTVYCTEKQLYTEEQSSGICGVLCSRYCSYIARVPCKLLMLPIGSSIHHQASCSSPIYLVTVAVEQWSSSGPNSDQPGRSSLDVLDECRLCRRQTISSSAFLAEQPGSRPPLCWCQFVLNIQPYSAHLLAVCGG